MGKYLLVLYVSAVMGVLLWRSLDVVTYMCEADTNSGCLNMESQRLHLGFDACYFLTDHDHKLADDTFVTEPPGLYFTINH